MDLSEPFHSVKKAITTLFRNPVYLIAFFLTIGLGGLLLLLPVESRNVQTSLVHAEDVTLGSFPLAEPTLRYGFALDTFKVTEGKINPGDYLGSILLKQGLNYPSIDKLAKNAEGVFDVTDLRQGKKYVVLSRDSLEGADYFVYEPSVYEYVVFNLKGDLQVNRVERPVTSEIRTGRGKIETSLWNAMIDNGMSFEVSSKMEDALQWSLDFTRLQKGDEFRLVYDQNFVNGEATGVGRVHAAYYKNIDREFYAIYFDNGEQSGYYDLEGRPMDKGFLKSPVKASRISSYYNLNRFHPILKRVRPHLGTDYAAPYGTPIYAVGDGYIAQASYTKGNGNYVKIRHDETYETQYLHMQKFAKGIRPGVHVKQGDVIGYVGSTGLATGPHVCFRFWKNGRQVNHLNLTFPPPEPLPEKDLPQFMEVRDQMLTKMKGSANDQMGDDETTSSDKILSQASDLESGNSEKGSS